MTTSTNSVIDKLMNLQEDFVTFVLIIMSLIFILTMIIYVIYLRNLQKTECNYMDDLYGKVDGNIRSIDLTLSDFSGNLYDYYIKTAYNSCSGGSYKNDFVNLCNLTNLLKQGVRCLDFELYCVDNKPVVATSTSSSVYVKETFNSVNFSDVMSTIQSNAFSGGSCPNPKDPLLIHLRCMSNNPIMYSSLANIFKSYDSIMLGKEYSYENHGHNLGYDYGQVKDNHVLQELEKYNQRNLTIVFPVSGSNPTNPSALFTREVGCQMTAIRYQLVDNYLEENNTFFDSAGFAFVLKPESLRYQETTVDAPTPQNPDYSYATKTKTTDYYSFNY